MERTYRSIFISDIHLGSRGCKADLLCDFLKNNTADNLYLVGDIIDGWRLLSILELAYYPLVNFFPRSHSRNFLMFVVHIMSVFHQQRIQANFKTG